MQEVGPFAYRETRRKEGIQIVEDEIQYGRYISIMTLGKIDNIIESLSQGSKILNMSIFHSIRMHIVSLQANVFMKTYLDH